MSAGDVGRRAVRRIRARLGRAEPAPLVRYRDGIPNRADEIVAGDRGAQALIDAGFLSIGAYSYGAPTLRLYRGDSATVRIGRYTAIAPDGVVFYPGGAHRTDWVTSYGLRAVFDLPGAYEDGTPTSRGDIVVGSDCWIASDVVVTSGVTVGDGAVLATRAVVTKDVRPYAVVAGNPAREVRRRFRDDQIEALLRIAWWDWPVERVLEHVDLLCSADVDGLIERFDHP